jgi:hypothetical protein
MAEQNANNVAITGGSITGVSGLVTSVTGTAPVVSSGGTTPAISMAAANTSTNGYLTSTDWNTFNGKGSGSVTSVAGTGTVSGISLSGTVTTTGNLTLGGTLDLSSPPAIGGTTPAAGTFTTLTNTNTATLGGDATAPALVAVASAGNTRWLTVTGTSAAGVNLNIAGAGNGNLILIPRGTGGTLIASGASSSNVQFAATHTASAVNYVQVTGAATTAAPVLSVQGSDGNVAFGITSKGTSAINFLTNSGNQRQLQINHTASAVNYFALTGSAAGSAPAFSVAGTDTDIDLTLTPKGAGNVRFGSYTASALLAVAGYITIKDSGGTTRRLLVG